MGHGVGLGLSISLGMMRSQGGTLTLEPGTRLTTFVLRMPAAVGEASAEEARSAERPQEGPALSEDTREGTVAKER